MIRVSNLRLNLEYKPDDLPGVAARALGVGRAEILSVRLARLSVDARDKADVHYVCTLDAECARPLKALPANASEAPNVVEWKPLLMPRASEPAPMVVGLGPAGLFAALALAKMGLRPLVIERGKDVDARAKDVKRLFDSGDLNPESNMLFGEGGAGAFSDGKLTTGIKDARCAWILRELVEAGAPEEILYEAKPHIGTDRLPGVVKRVRMQIERLGGRVLFETRLAGLAVENGWLRAARVCDIYGGQRDIAVNGMVLAIGHSARDTFYMLKDAGAPMARKPFSIGARIEHRQAWLNERQYGAFARCLGAADYKLNVKLSSGRGAYTFCMCPGGQVVPAASECGQLATNGMSAYLRDGKNANSALLVDVRTDDFPPEAGALAGVEFQRLWEARAFEAGGGGFTAPAQLAEDLIKGRASAGERGVIPSYRPGVLYTSLNGCLPAFAYDGLREALTAFERKIPGFAGGGAVLTGVETRSSSPVRILRDANTLESEIRGLYPAGEGAGYAGGILSAAVDGIRCAEKLGETERPI